MPALARIRVAETLRIWGGRGLGGYWTKNKA